MWLVAAACVDLTCFVLLAAIDWTRLGFAAILCCLFLAYAAVEVKK
jgi:hypothetical protein